MLARAGVIPYFHSFTVCRGFSCFLRLASYSFEVMTGFAGTPITTVRGGTSLVTTLPAATTADLPTIMLGRMVAPPPMIAFSSIIGGVSKLLFGYLSFSRLVFGAMNTLLPILHPLEIVVCAWMLQFFPIITALPMSQKLPMHVPSPIFAPSHMTT